jgi:hypothetical protein
LYTENYLKKPFDDFLTFYTVRTVAADLRQGEHIPKMQNDIGRKSKLRVLRQPRSKDRGGGAVCRAGPSAARPDPARHGVGFYTTAVNLRLIEFGSGSGKTTMTGSNLLPTDL